MSVSPACDGILHPVPREIELGEYAVKPRWFDTGCVNFRFCPGSERDSESHLRLNKVVSKQRGFTVSEVCS